MPQLPCNIQSFKSHAQFLESNPTFARNSAFFFFSCTCSFLSLALSSTCGENNNDQGMPRTLIFKCKFRMILIHLFIFVKKALGIKFKLIGPVNLVFTQTRCLIKVWCLLTECSFHVIFLPNFFNTSSHISKGSNVDLPNPAIQCKVVLVITVSV